MVTLDPRGNYRDTKESRSDHNVSFRLYDHVTRQCNGALLIHSSTVGSRFGETMLYVQCCSVITFGDIHLP